MIPAMFLLFVALALIGAATPRQADLLFGSRLRKRGRTALRLSGFALLPLSLALFEKDGDGARALVCWIGMLAMVAGLIVLAFSLLYVRSRR